MILQAALFLAGLSVASGSGCCPPPQFNAFQYVTIVNSTSTFRALYYVVYDGLNQRYSISGNRRKNNIGTTKVIYDYKRRTAYNIDVEKRTCTTSPVQGRFEDQEGVCVPRDAVYSGPLFYGYGLDTIRGLSYEYNRTTIDGRQQSVVTTVTKDDCIPLVITTTTTGGPGGNSLYMLGYNDVYPGIRELSTLDIPSYCR